MPGSHITSPLPEEKTHGQPASARLQENAKKKMIFNPVIAKEQQLKLIISLIMTSAKINKIFSAIVYLLYVHLSDRFHTSDIAYTFSFFYSIFHLIQIIFEAYLQTKLFICTILLLSCKCFCYFEFIVFYVRTSIFILGPMKET